MVVIPLFFIAACGLVQKKTVSAIIFSHPVILYNFFHLQFFHSDTLLLICLVFINSNPYPFLFFLFASLLL